MRKQRHQRQFLLVSVALSASGTAACGATAEDGTATPERSGPSGAAPSPSVSQAPSMDLVDAGTPALPLYDAGPGEAPFDTEVDVNDELYESGDAGTPAWPDYGDAGPGANGGDRTITDAGPAPPRDANAADAQANPQDAAKPTKIEAGSQYGG